jgi:shikimate kinase
VGFRQREAGELRRVASRGPGVLALGGGTLHQTGWQEVLAGFRIVVLQASWSLVQRRLEADQGGRPLAAKAQSLFQERLAGYQSAGIQIPIDGLSPEEVLECMLGRLLGGRNE